MADAESHISRGALRAIFNNQNKSEQNPIAVVQCLQVKPMPQQQPGAGERYRVVLSDMQNFCQGMLATQANHVVHDGKLNRGSIVRLKTYNATSLKGKNILIIIDLDVIESLGTPERLGDPVAFEAKPEEPTSNTIAGSGFYGTKQEDTKPAVAPRREMQQPVRGGGAPHKGNDVIYPIEAVSPYAHKWTIKARVSAKSDIKTWHKNTGEGKLFSVNLLDESGEIKATAFNDQVDQFFDLLQEGSVYYISSPCSVRLAKKQFTNLPCDYELTFERDTVIEMAEDQTNVPQVRFNFCGIQALNDVEKDTTVDVIGVLKEIQEVSQIVSKSTQKPYDKRELTIVDDSGYSVRVTVWGKTATNFDARTESVIAFKGVRVSDFGGRSLSLLSSGTMAVDPDIPECHKLKGWYDASGRNDNFATHNNMASMGGATGRNDQDKNIFQVKEENLGMEDAAYFTLKATVVYIKQDNFAYPACLSQGCNKKVERLSEDSWRCEKCDVTHDRPEYRYIMSVNVNDHTGQLWLNCFDEAGKMIMGKSADELMRIKEEDETRFAAEFESANCNKLSFRCRAKMDTFQDTPRVRYQVLSCSPIDYVAEANKLAEAIKQYEMM
ncbi:replication factor-a protein 1 [Coniella lustricola]|uniref:Replication protein A subunit n=1 Tax=Coniella lustricola TaxID=2025994 RepID=A0A2T3A2Z9_9PEZI|nr:replication factor-a protein 1 [Coniella lustricola]